MSYLKRIDLNIDVFLAHGWLALAWYEKFGRDF